MDRARSGDDVAATRAEVEQTRAEMSETIDALQQRLGPQTLKEQAKAQAKETARRAGSGFLKAVRDNAVADTGLALLGLLLARGLQGRRGSTDVSIDLRRGEVRGA